MGVAGHVDIPVPRVVQGTTVGWREAVRCGQGVDEAHHPEHTAGVAACFGTVQARGMPNVRSVEFGVSEESLTPCVLLLKILEPLGLIHPQVPELLRPRE